VGQLDQVDTEDIEPTAQVTGLSNVFRDGEADLSKCLSQDEVLSGNGQSL